MFRERRDLRPGTLLLGMGETNRLAKIFGSGDNPLRWALPLYRAFGIEVRVHIFFLLYIVGSVLFAIPRSGFGAGHTALLFGALFTLVLLHEYGHCFGARWRGGEADEILLWPLGGLASCRPPHDWLSHFITAAAGPAVNLVALPFLTGAVWLAAGDWRAAVFNPFDPGSAFPFLQAGSTLGAWLLTALWAAHYANFVLLAFNVLLPMYPMDGGRLAQAVLWRQIGYHRSMDIALLVGMVTAGVLALLAVFTEQVLLIAIAALGGFTCWFERRQLRFASSGGDDAVLEASREVMAEEQRERAKARKHREEAAKRQAEVDRILVKIKESGMGSLTKRERRTLDEASQADHAG